MHVQDNNTIFENLHIDYTIMNPQLGMIHYQEKDIYHFTEGLPGFQSYVSYAKTKLPGLEDNPSYGVLQSLENPNLCFILFFPNLESQEQEGFRQKLFSWVCNQTSFSEHLHTTHDYTANLCDIAFLVVINQNNPIPQFKQISCVQNAPLIFFPAQKIVYQVCLKWI